MAETRGPTQIQNRNFLAPVGFKFNLQRSPGVAYFCNQANIPDISLGVANNQIILEIYLHQVIRWILEIYH